MYSAFITPATTTNAPPTDGKKKKKKHDGDKDDEDDDHDRDNHKPGVPVDQLTQIMFSRSTDCGVTFSAPIKISDRTQINQGSGRGDRSEHRHDLHRVARVPQLDAARRHPHHEIDRRRPQLLGPGHRHRRQRQCVASGSAAQAATRSSARAAVAAAAVITAVEAAAPTRAAAAADRASSLAQTRRPPPVSEAATDA